MMRRMERERDLATFFLYIFGFMLLWEWIRPLGKLTDTGNIGAFVFFILFSLILDYFQIRSWIKIILKIFYVLNSIYVLFFEGGFFSSEWILTVLGNFLQDCGFLLSQQWTELSNVFRTILFFVLLSVMTYLMRYWLVNRKRILLFFVMTLIYITVLDTFTAFSAKAAIVRTVVIGFSTMGLLTLHRLYQSEKLSRDDSISRKWLTTLGIIISFSVGFAFIAPKAEPIWPDPVPFIKSLNEKSGTTSTIGYGVDDSKLGGPFTGDDSVVFRAAVDAKHYWRVESKDVYTGKGWISLDDHPERLNVLSGEMVPLYAFESDVDTKIQKATLYPMIEYRHLIYPFGVQSISGLENFSVTINPETEKIHIDNGRVTDYSFEYVVPKYKVSKLRAAKNIDQSRLDPLFIKRYTQLPDNLPPEIGELASEITNGKDNWFDQAKEIERYFDRTEYTYDQKNVAVPSAEDDYVAQFLLETKRGYCDNFSTSMAIMLRTLGIPARWVKGYSYGEFKKNGENGRKIYEVTNNNAHSWVEAYFPGSGWLAFEPTPGYSNNVALNFDSTQPDPNKAQVPIPVKKPDQEKLQKLKEEKEQSSGSNFSFKNFIFGVKLFLKNQWEWLVVAAIGVILLIVIAYRKRSRWMPHYLLWRFKNKKKDENLERAYLELLKQLNRYGLKRKPTQTLREYANYIDSFFSTKAMRELTEQYELLLYKGSIKTGAWEECKQLWENLIIKTIA